MTRFIRVAFLFFIVLYICEKFTHPLLVIPLVGCLLVNVNEEIKEYKDAKYKNNQRNQKVKDPN